MAYRGRVQMIEPVPVADVYCDDIGDVTVLGCCVRAVYYTFVRSENGLLQPVVAAKLIRPISSINPKGAVAQALKERDGIAEMIGRSVMHS